MAARAFQQKVNNLVEQLTLLQCRFDVGAYVQATGAVSGGPFVVGETITGGSSSATGTLVSFTPGAFVQGSPPSGTLVMGPPTLSAVTPAFQSAETLTGGTSSATVTSTSAFMSGAYNVQGNGINAVLRSPVATGTGVLGSWQLQLTDSYNYLMAFNAHIEPPGIITDIADGSFIVGGNYNITQLGTQNFVATFTNGTAVTSQVTATVGGVLTSVNQGTTATLSVAALAAAMNANAGLSQLASASASGAVLTIKLYNPNPPVAVPTSVSQVTDGSWALGLGNQKSMPATGWHYLGLPASVVPAKGAQFQALHTGSLTHAGDGYASTSYALSGTNAGDGANLIVLSAGKPDLGLRSSQPGVCGGYLNFQSVISSTGAAAELPVGARVYLKMLLRNSTVKGKGE